MSAPAFAERQHFMAIGNWRHSPNMDSAQVRCNAEGSSICLSLAEHLRECCVHGGSLDLQRLSPSFLHGSGCTRSYGTRSGSGCRQSARQNCTSTAPTPRALPRACMRRCVRRSPSISRTSPSCSAKHAALPAPKHSAAPCKG